MRGGVVAGWHWPSLGGDDRLIFLHANGFTAGTYRQFLTQLNFDGEIYGADLRGHGRATLAAEPATLRGWDIYAEDVAALIAALPAFSGRLFMAGHSLGAVVAVLAAAKLSFSSAGSSAGSRSSSVAGIALCEPVLFAPVMRRFISLVGRTPLHQSLSGRVPLIRQAKTRRATFSSRDQAEQRFAVKHPFKKWAPDCLSDYLEDGLHEHGSDTVGLACAPAWEAANYAAHRYDFWAAYKQIRAQGTPPAQLLMAAKGSTVHSSALKRFAADGARATAVPGTSHLLLMEKPHLCANHVTF